MANNYIGFSHNYTKLHGQTSGTLLSVRIFSRELLCDETIAYDTDGVFNLESGEYLQLVFLGDKQIPFTTYRSNTVEHRRRFCGHIDEPFEFKFKHSDKDKAVGPKFVEAANRLADAVREVCGTLYDHDLHKEENLLTELLGAFDRVTKEGIG